MEDLVLALLWVAFARMLWLLIISHAVAEDILKASGAGNRKTRDALEAYGQGATFRRSVFDLFCIDRWSKRGLFPEVYAALERRQ